MMNDFNDLFGNHYVACYVNVITYSCIFTDESHSGSEDFGIESLPVIAFLIYSAVIWCIAAQFHKHILKSVKQWYRVCMLNKSIHSSVTRKNFIAINLELCAEPIAITTNFFVVTYWFLTSVSKTFILFDYVLDLKFDLLILDGQLCCYIWNHHIPIPATSVVCYFTKK